MKLISYLLTLESYWPGFYIEKNLFHFLPQLIELNICNNENKFLNVANFKKELRSITSPPPSAFSTSASLSVPSFSGDLITKQDGSTRTPHKVLIHSIDMN